MVAARLADRVIGLTSTVILARLLLPADFGLVVMATVIVAALQLLGAFSFDLALIQNPNAERRHYDTVWTIGLIFATTFALAVVLLASPAAHFYNEPRLEAVMYVLSVGTFIDGLTNVGIVAFRKEMQFDKEFKFLFTRKLIAVTVTITLAFAWRDYWALVAGTLTGTIVAVCLSYLWQPYRPRFSLEARGELFRFSGWLFLNNSLGFLHQRAADFIIAKGIGPTGVGHYGLAYEIANLPSTELVAPINRAVFPGYAKMSADLADMRPGFINVISMIALLAVPAAVGLACVADPLVKVLLGAKWIATIPVIQVLALNGILTAFWACSGYMYLALGKQRHVTLVLSTHAVLAVPMITWAAFNGGIVGVAWMVLLASVLVLPLNHVLLSAALGIRTMDLVRVLWRPIVGAAVMAALVLSAGQVVASSSTADRNLALLFLYVPLGVTTYCGVVALLWWLSSCPAGAESFLLNRVKQAIAPVGRSAL